MAQYYSNYGGLLLQSSRLITPIVVRTAGESLAEKLTRKTSTWVTSIITPIHFLITPICVEIRWESLDGRKKRKLNLLVPYLKYIIIQLRLEEKRNYSNPG